MLIVTKLKSGSTFPVIIFLPEHMEFIPRFCSFPAGTIDLSTLNETLQVLGMPLWI
jgi:hypothetical protein